MPDIKLLDQRDGAVKQRILGLQRAAFGEFSDELYEHILVQSSHDTVIYGLCEGDEILAVNGFIAHSVQRNGESGLAYQSCMSATRKDQGGRGHFSSIINHAKQDLAERGGKFIFGFPNQNSAPIFIKKLGFSVSQNIPCIFTRFGPLPTPVMRSDRLLETNLSETRISFDQYQVADWKGNRYGGLFEYEALTNYLFGKVERRKIFGIEMPMLVIGGLEINKPLVINQFIRSALKRAGVHLGRVNANEAGPVANASRIRRDAGLTEPTIAFGLNWDVQAGDVEAYGGLKDVY